MSAAESRPAVLGAPAVIARLGISRNSLTKLLKGGAFAGVAFKPAGINEWRFDADRLEARIEEWKVAAGRVHHGDTEDTKEERRDF